jgi:thymidylate synthase ThyX
MKPAEVFCLVGKNGELLSPASQATILAKYSRSPLSAKVLVDQITEDEADKFQEKWVVNFGHNSVAELASLPICFEGISIVASKYIESWQRGGYSEKSTRYQEFSRDSFITPPGAPSTMMAFASRFYDAYESLMPKVVKRIAGIVGDDPENPKRTTVARAFDNVRYLLPAGTGTSVGANLFLRDIRGMISGLKGHTNPEFRMLGEQLEIAATSLAPALIRHTEPDFFQLPIKSLGPKFSTSGFCEPYVEINRSHMMPNPEMEQQEFEKLLLERHGMDLNTFSGLMNSRPQYSEVPDVFKTVKISFDIMMDYGAFRDLQRHRRCEQFVEPLCIDYGFVVPDDIVGTDLESEYREAMSSILAYEDESVIYDQDLFQYMIPLGYLHRSIFQMDLKELYYIIELRTKPQGHISYRRIAYRMYELAMARFPQLMQWCRVIKPDFIGEHK